MFIKLLKYDVNVNWKPQAALVISVFGLVLVALLVRMINHDLLTSLMIMLCVVVSAGVILSYIVFHVTGFYRTMVGGESYLTHTLPVRMNKIVNSKLIAALFWAVISIGPICLLWFVMLQGKIDVTGEVGYILKITIPMIVTQFLCMMTLLVFCISLSVHPMFSNIQSKILTSVVSYIVLYYACSFIQLVVMGIGMYVRGDLMAVINNQMDDAQALAMVKDMFVAISLTYVVLAAAFYGLAVRIFERKKSI